MSCNFLISLLVSLSRYVRLSIYFCKLVLWSSIFVGVIYPWVSETILLPSLVLHIPKNLYEKPVVQHIFEENIFIFVSFKYFLGWAQ